MVQECCEREDKVVVSTWNAVRAKGGSERGIAGLDAVDSLKNVSMASQEILELILVEDVDSN